jgi:hypothetical protein
MTPAMSEPAQSPIADTAVPRGGAAVSWQACAAVAAGLIVWAELADVRAVLLARSGVTTWGWVRAGVLYGALAALVLVFWERAVVYLRAGRFWVVLVGLIALLYRPAWLVEDLPRRLASGSDVAGTIEAPRTHRPIDPVVPYVASSDERFGSGLREDFDLASMFEWTTPSGWRVVPAGAGQSDRVVTFALPGNSGGECYVSVLAGSGGGLAANFARWRSQVGLEPLTAAAIDALPRRTLLGREAPLLECEGSFRGPNDAQSKPGYKLLGLCLEGPSFLITLKMIGPAAIVDAQRAGFEELRESLRLSQRVHEGVARGGDGARASDPPVRAALLAWTAPAHWQRGADRFGREVTFTAPGEVECWVSVLGGDGGGLRANVDRWRDQLGLPALAAGEEPRLLPIAMLGRPGHLLEVVGEGKHAGRAMLVAMCPFEAGTVFVRMTGPQPSVAGERGAFEAFCASLRKVE